MLKEQFISGSQWWPTVWSQSFFQISVSLFIRTKDVYIDLEFSFLGIQVWLSKQCRNPLLDLYCAITKICEHCWWTQIKHWKEFGSEVRKQHYESIFSETSLAFSAHALEQWVSDFSSKIISDFATLMCIAVFSFKSIQLNMIFLKSLF